jgi:Ni,Fe-hydrogenase maturation factor
MRIVILGLGNIFLIDEGAGLHVIDQREKTCLLPAKLEIIKDMAP